MPAFSELPMISVVHPAYQAFPNGGQGSFFASPNRRFNCVLVFATIRSSSALSKIPGAQANQHNSDPRSKAISKTLLAADRVRTFCWICDSCPEELAELDFVN